MLDVLLIPVLVLAVLGCLYLGAAILLTGRHARRRVPEPGAFPSITVIKPLHGLEPGLFENLASFCAQDYPGPVQIVLGVADPRDPALAVVEELRRAFPQAALELVVDARRHGSNRKVSNLINMAERIRHDVVVFSDSDVRVPADHLRQMVAELQAPGIGCVTCLYHGVPTGGTWSRLIGLGMDTHFTPSVIVGLGLRLARPCIGTTIVMDRDMLAEIGGLTAFADLLAEDHAIGAAVWATGRKVAVSTQLIGHLCSEASAATMWAHELRWARTIKSIDPLGYAGSLITHPLPLALIAWALGGGWPALATAGLAAMLRIALCIRFERAYSLPPRPYWLIPARDLLAFAVFVVSYLGSGVNWRGHLYQLVPDGTLVTDRRPPSP
ncbi:glycosyltransferase [Mycobacterium sp. KBS0706]|uniref:bacteriohopanetetrol glucosamine biosynthesis glycosyltransferase HpnI n=1 Tax=Mycobacterium sp. KBS0706 TaxID=2578109 RepID=UPI00110F8B0D|nr:bacteriohopanetetrol glucosamine biosynthesis glycosyltransferase HpnI [Mycobacterium sp. KBS0706]TSD88332.1 glycosyltransferase [Mycobacterium sp. KBS0706]